MKKKIRAKNFDGELHKIPEMRGWVDEQLQAFQVGEEISLGIRLAITEALSNIFKYAYQNEAVKPVRITVCVDEARVQLSLRDFGEPMNLLEYQPPDLTKAAPGGYGIFLINKLMDGVQYFPRDVGTELIIWKKWK